MPLQVSDKQLIWVNTSHLIHLARHNLETPTAPDTRFSYYQLQLMKYTGVWEIGITTNRKSRDT